jgi:hypothetical protein
LLRTGDSALVHRLPLRTTRGATCAVGRAPVRFQRSREHCRFGRSYISQGSMATLYETPTDRTLSPKTDEEVAELAAA